MEIPNVLDFYYPATYSEKSRQPFSAFPAIYKVEGSKFRSDAQVYF